MDEKNDQTVAHQAADVVDNVAHSIRSVAHTVGGTVQNAAQTVRKAAGNAASAVGDTYEEVGQRVRDSVTHSRAKVRSWENSFESCVRENPKTSLLIAAGLGAIIVAWWKRK